MGTVRSMVDEGRVSSTVIGDGLSSEARNFFSGSRYGAVEFVFFSQFGKQASGQDLLLCRRQRCRLRKCLLLRPGVSEAQKLSQSWSL